MLIRARRLPVTCRSFDFMIGSKVHGRFCPRRRVVPIRMLWAITTVVLLLGGTSAMPRLQAAPVQNAAEPVRVGPDVHAPTKIKDVQPQYPTEAVRAGVQGIVWVEITVGTNGHVEAARV